MAQCVPDRHVGGQVDGEATESRELRAVEDEDLGDQQPDQDAAQEPSVGLDPGCRQGQHADPDEGGPGKGRDDLPEVSDTQARAGALGGDDQEQARRHGRGRVDDDGPGQDAREPRIDHGTLVVAGEPARDGLPPGIHIGFLGQSLDVAMERHDELGLRVRLGEEVFDPLAVVAFEGPDQSDLDEVESVGQSLALGERTTPGDGPPDDEQDHQHDVDQGHRGPEEVVVVGRHELADLVDERPEAQAGDDRGDVLDRPVEVGEQEQQRDQHQRAAPQHVGDMESALPDLREPGQRQEPADREDRDDRGDDEALEVEHPVVVPERPGQARSVHRSLLFGSCTSTLATPTPTRGPAAPSVTAPRRLPGIQRCSNRRVSVTGSARPSTMRPVGSLRSGHDIAVWSSSNAIDHQNDTSRPSGDASRDPSGRPRSGPLRRSAGHRTPRIHRSTRSYPRSQRSTNARYLFRTAIRHPASRELGSASLIFLPGRYLPLGWAATWAARKVARRFVDPSAEVLEPTAFGAKRDRRNVTPEDR